MRKLLFIALTGLTLSIACTRSLPEDKGCMERDIIRVTDHAIAPSDVAVANELFQANRLDNSHFRYLRYLHDSVQTYYPPFAKIDSKGFVALQYTNGLPIFTGTVSFVFHNGIFTYQSGRLTHGTSLNAPPILTLGQLRRLFLDDARKFDYEGDRFKDSCLKAEFGYYNIPAKPGDTTENLTMAWRVTLKNNDYGPYHEYPLAFYMNNGKRIYYDNGIRTIQ